MGRVPEVAGLLGAVLMQHGGADELVDAGRDRRLGNAAQSRVEEHRLAHGQLVDERVELRAVAELAAGVVQRLADAVTRQVRVTARRADVARQHPERRRLPGAVDAQQPETLALRHTAHTSQRRAAYSALSRHGTHKPAII